MGRSEALDMFGKWLTEGTLIACNFEFRLLAAVFRGRVKAVTAAELSLLSDDTFAELTLALPADLDFWYGDNRADPDAGELAGVVCVSRPSPPDEDFRDVICLSEVTVPS